MAPKTKPDEGEKKKRENGPRGWFGVTPGLLAAIGKYHARLMGPDRTRISRAEACRKLVIVGLRAEGIDVGEAS